MTATDLLIVGAGPFGLAMAAEARGRGIDHEVVGESMAFWKRNMPSGMLLRSGRDWNLDPTAHTSLARYLDDVAGIEDRHAPISLSTYLDYVEWMMQAQEIRPRESRVTRLDADDGGFRAALEDGSVISAKRVLLALGFAAHANVPRGLCEMLPPACWMHSCDVASPSEFAGKRVLIIGGRQSAFETGALLAEAGAQSVHIAPRHDLPRFEPSDWSWVGALLERIGKQPGWYRALDPNEKSELDARFWAEGRLKLEPWLGPRVQHPAIALHPGTNVENARSHDGGVKITLDDGSVFEVDTVVFATGYKPRLDRVRLLSEGNLLPAIETQDGVPLLDECLQTTVPGLYMTSLMATQAFGPFFAFTASAATAARIVGRSLQAASKT